MNNQDQFKKKIRRFVTVQDDNEMLPKDPLTVAAKANNAERIQNTIVVII